MREVVERYGIPAQLYTDRHSVYWYTQKTGGKVDRERLTQFGRAMEEAGADALNVTGGTKLMAVAAQEVFRAENKPVFYVNKIRMENYFCPEDSCASQIIDLIENAKTSVYFMSFSFTNEKIADALIKKNDLDVIWCNVTNRN